jgi:hypothetical protein
VAKMTTLFFEKTTIHSVMQNEKGAECFNIGESPGINWKSDLMMAGVF